MAYTYAIPEHVYKYEVYCIGDTTVQYMHRFNEGVEVVTTERYGTTCKPVISRTIISKHPFVLAVTEARGPYGCYAVVVDKESTLAAPN